MDTQAAFYQSLFRDGIDNRLWLLDSFVSLYTTSACLCVCVFALVFVSVRPLLRTCIDIYSIHCSIIEL